MGKSVFQRLSNNRKILLNRMVLEATPVRTLTPQESLRLQRPVKEILRHRKKVGKAKFFFSKKSPEEIIDSIELFFKKENPEELVNLRVFEVFDDNGKLMMPSKSRNIYISKPRRGYDTFDRIMEILRQRGSVVMTNDVAFYVEVRNMETPKLHRKYKTFHSYKSLAFLHDLIKRYVTLIAEKKRDEIWFDDTLKKKSTHSIILSKKGQSSRCFSINVPGVTNEEIMMWVERAGKANKKVIERLEEERKNV